jgi:hypothetical protein
VCPVWLGVVARAEGQFILCGAPRLRWVDSKGGRPTEVLAGHRRSSGLGSQALDLRLLAPRSRLAPFDTHDGGPQLLAAAAAEQQQQSR